MKAWLTKMSGTGNDFIVVNLFHQPEQLEVYFPQKTLPQITQTICDRHHHLGADGAIFLVPSERGSHFAWKFFNSDGSIAEMCGNAARCVTFYAFTRCIAPKSLVFDSIAGLIYGEVLEGNNVRVKMPPLTGQVWGENLKIANLNIKYDYLDVGVPHVVHQISPYRVDTSLLVLAKELRSHPIFFPKGANITFYSIEKNHLRSITYERGVEDWTLSCGTGVVAAALSYNYWGESKNLVDICVPGGKLIVDLSENRPHLTGSVKLIADIQLCKL